MSDRITISRLKVSVFIGVPDEERAEAQSAEISLDLFPERALTNLQDEIAETIDYYQVSRTIISVAQERPRKLIETLNEDILRAVLTQYPLSEARITTYKFIIPDTEHVSVEMSLTRSQVV